MSADIFYLSEDLRARLGGRVSFDDFLHIEGETYREVANRRTVRFERGGRAYFIKVHLGVGWPEIFKNLLSLRLPILGAANEWGAIRRLGELGVRTPRAVAYGERGRNPASRESFIVTEDIGPAISLEDLCATWPASPPSPRFKWQLIEEVAAIARRMHEHGINHRDFYLCHFQRPITEETDPGLILMDLHRAQIREKTPRRWVIKDIGGLYFSAMDIGLTRRDLYRFMRAYRQAPLKETLRNERVFWREVAHRAQRLYEE